MNTTIRRVAATRVRALAVRRGSRTYATFPREEPDPQLNGYPELPSIPRQNLPPLGWTDNLTRRNFGDTVRLIALLLGFS